MHRFYSTYEELKQVARKEKRNNAKSFYSTYEELKHKQALPALIGFAVLQYLRNWN